MCDMTHSYVWHDSFTCVTGLIHMCDMTHSCVWSDSFICVKWPIHMCDVPHSYVWQHSSTCVTWIIQKLDTAHSYVWHDSSICVTWLIHMCKLTHLYVWHDSLTYIHIYNTWLIHRSDWWRILRSWVLILVSSVWHDFFICVTWLTHMRDMTHSPEWLMMDLKTRVSDSSFRKSAVALLKSSVNVFKRPTGFSKSGCERREIYTPSEQTSLICHIAYLSLSPANLTECAHAARPGPTFEKFYLGCTN